MIAEIPENDLEVWVQTDNVEFEYRDDKIVTLSTYRGCICFENNANVRIITYQSMATDKYSKFF